MSLNFNLADSQEVSCADDCLEEGMVGAYSPREARFQFNFFQTLVGLNGKSEILAFQRTCSEKVISSQLK
jgi:hypothetical protein